MTKKIQNKKNYLSEGQKEKTLFSPLDIKLFNELSRKDIKSIETSLSEKELESQEFLFMHGKHCDQVYFVKSGRIKVFRTAFSGREQILHILHPGDTCACYAGSPGWSCSASAQAMVDSMIWCMPRGHFQRLVDGNPKLLRKLAQVLSERLCGLNALVEKVSLDDPQRRLVKFLLDVLSEPKDPKQESAGHLIFLTHEEIAHRIGLVRETVTRHLRRLKESTLIKLSPRCITVLDKEGLEKILTSAQE